MFAHIVEVGSPPFSVRVVGALSRSRCLGRRPSKASSQVCCVDAARPVTDHHWDVAPDSSLSSSSTSHFIKSSSPLWLWVLAIHFILVLNLPLLSVHFPVGVLPTFHTKGVHSLSHHLPSEICFFHSLTILGGGPTWTVFFDIAQSVYLLPPPRPQRLLPSARITFLSLCASLAYCQAASQTLLCRQFILLPLDCCSQPPLLSCYSKVWL